MVRFCSKSIIMMILGHFSDFDHFLDFSDFVTPSTGSFKLKVCQENHTPVTPKNVIFDQNRDFLFTGIYSPQKLSESTGNADYSGKK